MLWCRRGQGQWLASAIVSAVLIGAGACATAPRPTTPVSDASGPEDRIGIDDTFDVRVYGEAELTGTFRVATDGSVDYPLAGRIHVAGLRTGQIQQLLVDRLKDRYLKDPQVIVTVKDRNSQKIS